MSTTIRQLLQPSFSVLPLLEKRMLLEHVLGVNRAWLIAHDEVVLKDAQYQQFQALVQRRLSGEPMAYILGVREFMGLSFDVGPDVLIPRPETELLVETGLSYLSATHSECPHVLDLGTGSGVVAVSLAKFAPHAHVVAVDKSQSALSVASQNAQKHQVEVSFVQSDWFSNLPVGLYDLILSNPPYIASDDVHLKQGDLRFEPADALTDFSDGLSAICRIIHTASGFLKPGAWIWLEHGWNQAERVRALFAEYAYHDIKSLKDYAGIERITGACWL